MHQLGAAVYDGFFLLVYTHALTITYVHISIDGYTTVYKLAKFIFRNGMVRSITTFYFTVCEMSKRKNKRNDPGDIYGENGQV